MLRSGAAGEVRVEAGHVLGDVLQPVSLNLLLAQQWARAGLMLVHGAAFELDGTGILALGERGAGKSVLTAAVLAAGGRVVSDDWVMLGITADGTFHAERLRDFLMFRTDRATQSLLARLDDLRVIEQRHPPKQVVRIGGESSRFPQAVRIDQTWLLRRPRARRRGSTSASLASPLDAMRSLTGATTPIVLSNRCPVERRVLLETVRRLTQELPVCQIDAGLDLVETPTETLLGIGALRPGAR
jgi:hypothetical protein